MSIHPAAKSALSSNPAADLAKEPAISPAPPLLSRIKLGVRLWLFKAVVALALRSLRMVQARQMKKIAPTYTKRYPIRPMLENRVFVPADCQADSRLPLFIDIHGGGFALCDPQTDDEFCHHLANKYHFLVVSINYRKAPVYPFPELVHDAAEMARAVLSDTDIPVDHSRIAMGGFSAGGNLTLAIAQLPGIKEKVQKLVPVYPVVDFSRKFGGPYRTTKDGKPDILQNTSALFNWAYINTGQDRSDPLLSPIYATREQLPHQIFFVGAEYDCLCHEAEIMAKNLAGYDNGDTDSGSTWERNGIRWRMIPDQQHGFTHLQQKGDDEMNRQLVCDELYREIAQWLQD